MKTEEWKFGYIRENEVIVFDNPVYSFRVFGGHFLENVKVMVGENGTLRITGNEIVYDLYTHKTPFGRWINEPEDSEVRVRKVGIFRRRLEKYLVGWIKTKKRIPFDLEFGNSWILERRGNVNEGLSSKL